MVFFSSRIPEIDPARKAGGSAWEGVVGGSFGDRIAQVNKKRKRNGAPILGGEYFRLAGVR